MQHLVEQIFSRPTAVLRALNSLEFFRCGKQIVAFLAATVFFEIAGFAQLIVADDFNVSGNGTGFALNSGINSGINPPLTRLTGPAAANARYIPTANKAASAFSISGNKLQVTPAANPGRLTLSTDGVTPLNLAPALGTASATPANPVVYDMSVRMANNSPGIQRFSFALGTAEGDANSWNFAVQLYRASDTHNFYTIGKRIDTASSGLASDLNAFITNTAAGTYGSEIQILIRVTDAGAETTTFNSRVQVSLDDGVTWIYDTANDSDLPAGWRLPGAGRYVIWDIAPGAGPVTYDDFSLAIVSTSVTVISPSANASNVGPSPVLQIAVSNTVPGEMTVTFYGRETPQLPAADFCIAVMPDTQNYAREASGQGEAIKEMWFAQTEWLVTNRVSHNIVYLAHLGDCVQNGDIKNGGPNTTEWRNATNAMYRLENPNRTLLPEGIPYGISVGNHDQEPIGEPDGESQFYNQYFGVDHFAGRKYYGGHFASNNDNHFDLFSAGGMDFIVFYFEFGRHGSGVINWANSVLATNQHRRAIAVTHWMGSDSTPCNLSPHGQDIFDGLKDHPGFFLLLGGHVFDNGGEGSRVNNHQGRAIRTFISNYQGRMNGGNGWMRLMYFSPTNNLVTIKTFSPWLNQYETDANSQMTFPYDMNFGGAASPGTPYIALATNTGVMPGALTSAVWAGLQSNKNYDWFVTVTDQSGNQFTSTTSSFTTIPNAAPMASNQFVTVVGDEPTPLAMFATDANDDAITFQAGAPTRGLISNLDTNSGSLIYLPARGYRGPDRITYQASDGFDSSAPAAININVIAPPDNDADGLPDAWETIFGISEPQEDADGDGQSNLAEYFAGTNPTNAVSALRIVGSAQEANGNFLLTWSSVGGTRYRVQFSDVGDGNFTDVLRSIQDEMDAAPYGSASTQSFTDVSLPANGFRFYRVKVVP